MTSAVRAMAMGLLLAVGAQEAAAQGVAAADSAAMPFGQQFHKAEAYPETVS